MKFKVGDRVEWAGVRGVVKSQSQVSPRCEVWLEVEFDAYFYGVTKATSNFLEDGRLSYWHKEPSLKLLDSES